MLTLIKAKSRFEHFDWVKRNLFSFLDGNRYLNSLELFISKILT